MADAFTDDSLAEYIYGSAEVVGLMCLRVFQPMPGAVPGHDEELRRGRPRRLGAAFQKVNFLRDLAADYVELGRSYFPGVDPAGSTEGQKLELVADIRADLDAAGAGIPLLPPGARAQWPGPRPVLRAGEPARARSRGELLPAASGCGTPQKAAIALRVLARPAAARTERCLMSLTSLKHAAGRGRREHGDRPRRPAAPPKARRGHRRRHRRAGDGRAARPRRHTGDPAGAAGRRSAAAPAWEHDGFRFDTGPSWYLMPEVFDHFFRLLGTRPPSSWTWSAWTPATGCSSRGSRTAARRPLPTGEENRAPVRAASSPGAGRRSVATSIRPQRPTGWP